MLLFSRCSDPEGDNDTCLCFIRSEVFCFAAICRYDPMPRISRGLADNHYYHLLNRGNGQQQVFLCEDDYRVFVDLLRAAKERYPLHLYGYCLMPNHFHLLVKPEKGEDLSRWMQWLMTSHVRRHHRVYRTSGHIWQGRYKSFLVQDADYMLTLLRYIEGNPVRTGLVSSSVDWRWGSSCDRGKDEKEALVDLFPLQFPEDWVESVDQPLTDKERERYRLSIKRQAPFGSKDWQMRVCERYGLESTMKKKGRPLKEDGQ